MREHRHAVYIGRFQPFHNGHLAVVKQGLKLADKLVIIVGSAGAAPNTKNPWSYDEREAMIKDAIRDELGAPALARVQIVGVRDYFYNENTWIRDVQAKTAALGVEEGALLLGNYKDASSFYLKLFPQWEFTPVKMPNSRTNVLLSSLNATSIRTKLFDWEVLPNWEGKASEGTIPPLDYLDDLVPKTVADYLRWWVKNKPTYVNLVQESSYIKRYRESWASAPFPPTFVTTDAIVVCSGHVLVVRRKHNPGKGLYALPGGFLKASEFIEDGMLRELREETKIKVDKLILRSSIVEQKVFDHPERSLRGRTITHGFHIKLKDGPLPEVKADDDAAEVLWMPLMDVAAHEREFFEDHAHIINYFIAQ